MESIARSSRLVQVYEGLLPQENSEKNLHRLRYLMKLYLSNQVRLLSFSAHLDAKAAPLQQEGIPIICQDVPPIPMPSAL